MNFYQLGTETALREYGFKMAQAPPPQPPAAPMGPPPPAPPAVGGAAPPVGPPQPAGAGNTIAQSNAVPRSGVAPPNAPPPNPPMFT